MVKADYAEQEVFKTLERLTSDFAMLKAIVDNVNHKIAIHKEPLRDQFKVTDGQIKKIKQNIENYLQLFEDDRLPATIIKDKLKSFEAELNTIEERKRSI